MLLDFKSAGRAQTYTNFSFEPFFFTFEPLNFPDTDRIPLEGFLFSNMAKKSKLLLALDAHKGRDYDAEKQKKLVKSAEKRKKAKKAEDDDDAEEEGEKEVEEQDKVCLKWGMDT